MTELGSTWTVTYRCTNAACTEMGVDKLAEHPLDPPVHCGVCEQECERVA